MIANGSLQATEDLVQEMYKWREDPGQRCKFNPEHKARIEPKSPHRWGCIYCKTVTFSPAAAFKPAQVRASA